MKINTLLFDNGEQQLHCSYSEAASLWHLLMSYECGIVKVMKDVSDIL